MGKKEGKKEVKEEEKEKKEVNSAYIWSLKIFGI